MALRSHLILGPHEVLSLFFRQHRQIAYRQLCPLQVYIHRSDRLGKHDRKVRAARAVNEMRKTFPENDGQYVDFKEINDALDALCGTVFDLGRITISHECPRVFTFSYNILCPVQFQNAIFVQNYILLITLRINYYLDCDILLFTKRTGI